MFTINVAAIGSGTSSTILSWINLSQPSASRAQAWYVPAERGEKVAPATKSVVTGTPTPT